MFLMQLVSQLPALRVFSTSAWHTGSTRISDFNCWWTRRNTKTISEFVMINATCCLKVPRAFCLCLHVRSNETHSSKLKSDITYRLLMYLNWIWHYLLSLHRLPPPTASLPSAPAIRKPLCQQTSSFPQRRSHSSALNPAARWGLTACVSWPSWWNAQTHLLLTWVPAYSITFTDH